MRKNIEVGHLPGEDSARRRMPDVSVESQCPLLRRSPPSRRPRVPVPSGWSERGTAAGPRCPRSCYRWQFGHQNLTRSCPARPRLALPDRRPAAPAGPPRPPVHPALPPGPGVPGRHVPRPLLVRVEQPVAQRNQRIKIRDRADRPRRVNAPQEQRLRHVDGPKASEVPLIEQRLPDGPPRVADQARRGGRRVPVGAEQVRAEVTDDLVLPRGRQHLGDAELVPGGYPLGVREQEPQPVAVPQAVVRRPAESARHPPSSGGCAR